MVIMGLSYGETSGKSSPYILTSALRGLLARESLMLPYT